MKNIARSNQAGFTLVEVIVACIVGVLIILALTTVVGSRFRTIENNSMTEEASERGDEALAALTARVADLELGGSLSVSGSYPDQQINLLDCTPSTCDTVYEPQLPDSFATSPAKGLPFGLNPPVNQGYFKTFSRRWLIESVDDDYRLRRVTIAVFDDESKFPVVLEQNIVSVNEN